MWGTSRHTYYLTVNRFQVVTSALIICPIQFLSSVANGELNALYNAGTPKDEFRNLLEQGQNAVVSIKQNVRQLRVETVLQDLYHTSNVSRLPECA